VSVSRSRRRCTELQTQPAGVGLEQMAVVRTGVSEAVIDENRDPRASQQDVDGRRRFLPGTGGPTTNLKPRQCRALRKASSGWVPDLLVRRITREVAEDSVGGLGPGSRSLYTTPESRDGPTPSGATS
jgi:hypothetical protein